MKPIASQAANQPAINNPHQNRVFSEGEPTGILALWNQCKAGLEAEFESWYQHEHLPERLAIDGIRRGRRYESIAGDNHFFTYYEADSSAVFQSDQYQARVNSPTPLTQKVMAGIAIGLSRTVCDTVSSYGSVRGGFVVTIKLAGADSIAQANRLAATLVTENTGVARAEIWQAIQTPDLPVSAEEKIRGQDTRITACLIIETLRLADAQGVAAQLRSELTEQAESAGVYQLLCELTS